MTGRHHNPGSSLLVILASANKKSIHKDLLTQFENYGIKNNYSFSSLDIRELTSLPYNLLGQETPKEIKELNKIIKEYKNILFFTPEHVAHLSAFFKNILDGLCMDVDRCLQGKRVFILSASTTEKVVRMMEKGVWNTIFTTGNPGYTFINFNKYVEGKDETERIEKITKDIFSTLI